jgi:hypothetical protein
MRESARGLVGHAGAIVATCDSISEASSKGRSLLLI